MWRTRQLVLLCCLSLILPSCNKSSGGSKTPVGPVPPSPPTALVCVDTGLQVTLSWTNGDTYDVIRIRRDGVLLPSLLLGTQTSFLDTNVPTGQHTYSVVGIHGSIESSATFCSVSVAQAALLWDVGLWDNATWR